jgi:hypothetical protein
MVYLTFDQWTRASYKIKKGSKAVWIDGVAKFSKDQVEEYFPRWPQDSYDDYESDSEQADYYGISAWGNLD